MSASRSLVAAFSSKKINFQFSPLFLFLASAPRKIPATTECFDNFHSIFPLPAPLTEMTRLLLIVLRALNLTFPFVSLSECSCFSSFWQKILHNLFSSQHGKFVSFFLHLAHILALHLISHDQLVFFLSLHLLFFFRALATQKTGYFRFSVLVRLKKKSKLTHCYRIDINRKKMIMISSLNQPQLSFTNCNTVIFGNST